MTIRSIIKAVVLTGGVVASAGGGLIPRATDQPVSPVETDTCLTDACLTHACSGYPSTTIQIKARTMRYTEHSLRHGEEYYKPTAGLVFQVNRRILRGLGFDLLGEGNYSARIVSIEDSNTPGRFHRSLGQFAKDVTKFGYRPITNNRKPYWKFIETNKLKIAKAYLCGIGDFHHGNVFYKNHDKNTEFIIVDFDNRLFQPIIPDFIGQLLDDNNINELIDFLESKQYLDTIDQTLVELRYSEQGIDFFKQHIATAIESLRNKKFTNANGDEMDDYVVPEVYVIINGDPIPDTRKPPKWDRPTFENVMLTRC